MTKFKKENPPSKGGDEKTQPDIPGKEIEIETPHEHQTEKGRI